MPNTTSGSSRFEAVNPAWKPDTYGIGVVVLPLPVRVGDVRGLGLLTADAAGVIGIVGKVNAQGAAHGIGTGNKP